MNCPHCRFRFGALAANDSTLPELAPLVCENCAGVSLLVDGAIRKPTDDELRAIQSSPAWRDVVLPVRELIRDTKVPPADRSKVCLSDGKPITEAYQRIDPVSGMQQGYIVLSDEERAKGFARPLRSTYTHLVCGSDTSMGWRIAETYARDPKFYGATYCCACRKHFPVGADGEFVWKGTNERVGT